MATPLEVIASELLKSAIDAEKLFGKTKDQSYKDKAVRLRRIVVNLQELTIGTSSVATLNDLTDVTISAPANAQVLTYNSTTGQWENQTPAAGGGGNMNTSTYDVDNDGIVDGSETTQIIVRNSTGSTLTKGQVVYLSGATGNRPNALLSQANTEATSSKTIGIVIANIANNSDGYVAVNGTLHDLDTSAFTAGDAVWLSATTAGAYTSTIPAEPNHTVFIGYVARSHPTQGRLVIAIQNGYELNELHGVLISSEANNDLLVYETSSTLWKNKSISTIFGGTPLVSVPTLAQVTTAGNTTTNAITVGGLTANNKVYLGSNTPHSNDATNIVTVNGIMSLSNGYIRIDGQNRVQMSTSTWIWDTAILPTAKGFQGYSILDFTLRTGSTSYNLDLGLAGQTNLRVANTTGNILINTTTDAGYKLDVNGIARVVTRIDAGSFTPGAGASAYTFATTGQITAAGGYNLRTPTVGDSGFSGLINDSGPSIYVNNTMVARFNTVGGALNGINLDILQGYNPGAGTGNVTGLRHSYSLYPSVDNTVSYTSFVSAPYWQSAPFYNRITGPIRGFYFVNGLYNTQKLVDVIAFQSAGGRVLFEGELPSASAGISRGVYINQTHTAAANNDVLVGLDINPTFTNGAFTGVANAALRVQGWNWATTGVTIGPIGVAWDTSTGPVNGFTLDRSGVYGRFRMGSGSGFGYQFFTNSTERLRIVDGNVMVLNTNMLVGTTTDAGYKLDVVGTIRATSQMRSGAIRFWDQGVIGATADGTTLASDYNTASAKTVWFWGDMRFGAFTTPASIYYFGARYGGTVSTYALANFMTLGVSGPETFGANTGTTTGTILNIIPPYNYTGGTHTVRGIYYNPTLTSMTGVTHRAIETTSGDVILNTQSAAVNAGYTTVAVGGSDGVYFQMYVGPSPTSQNLRGQLWAVGNNLLLNNPGAGYLGLFTTLYSGITIWPTTGNVYVGASPSTDAGFKLDVAGTARVQTNLNVGDTAFTATTPNYISLGGTYANSGYGAKLKLLDSGATQWGIGVSTAGINYYGTTHNFFADSTTSAIILSPSANTASTSPAYIAIGQSYSSVAGSNPKLRLFGTTYGFGVSAGQVDYIAPTHVFYANGSEAIRISSTGNVGIGTSTPSYPLHISSAAAANIFGTVQSTNANGTAAWVAFNDQTDNVVYRVFGSGASGTQMGIALARTASLIANLGGSGKFLIGTYSGTDLVFGTSDTARLKLVDSTGNFLVGTMTDLGNRLEVSGTINSTGYKINNVIGYTGILNIVTNPPGMQNIDIQSGIIVNIF